MQPARALNAGAHASSSRLQTGSALPGQFNTPNTAPGCRQKLPPATNSAPLPRPPGAARPRIPRHCQHPAIRQHPRAVPSRAHHGPLVSRSTSDSDTRTGWLPVPGIRRSGGAHRPHAIARAHTGSTDDRRSGRARRNRIPPLRRRPLRP